MDEIVIRNNSKVDSNKKPIPYGRQNITQDDIDVVINVLKSDYLTQGPKIAEFEEAFASYVGSQYAVAVSNGTAALHLSALALDVKEGDKVITTPITFAATANCIRYCGGEVIFADIDPDTYLLDPTKVRELLEASPKGSYKGLIPVDFAGRALDLEAFRLLADEYDLWIIEDACHAPGGYFIDDSDRPQYCGNGTYSELSIFSFHPVKHIAAGEGGMITTNNEALYRQLTKLRTHGITKNEAEFKNPVNFAIGDFQGTRHKTQEYPGWYMEMQGLGFNYRITDFQAALGLSQLNRAHAGILRRREIAERYRQAFEGQTFIINQSGIVDGHAYHLYVIEVKDRFGLYNFLREHKIYAQIHYIPLHLMPYYRQFGWKEGDLPNAEKYYKGCISLPVYPTLDREDQEYVINKIIEYYEYL